jgi:hypothetical protein
MLVDAELVTSVAVSQALMARVDAEVESNGMPLGFYVFRTTTNEEGNLVLEFGFRYPSTDTITITLRHMFDQAGRDVLLGTGASVVTVKLQQP